MEALTVLAHKYGLLVDAYIGLSTDRHTFGLTADTPADVTRVAKDMESIGVDFIGIMTGMSYEGAAADAIPQAIIERLNALNEAVKVPTLAEGGINTENVKAFRSTGVNILVVGTSFDDVARKAVGDTVKMYLP